MKNKYVEKEMERAEENHNTAYKMRVKFYGTNGESNFLVISKVGYEKIKLIMGKEQ